MKGKDTAKKVMESAQQYVMKKTILYIKRCYYYSWHPLTMCHVSEKSQWSRTTWNGFLIKAEALCSIACQDHGHMTSGPPWWMKFWPKLRPGLFKNRRCQGGGYFKEKCTLHEILAFFIIFLWLSDTYSNKSRVNKKRQEKIV